MSTPPKHALVQSETFQEGFHPADIPRASHGRGTRISAGTVPWEVHLKAWKGYAAAGHGDQSAERINERGGFGYREIQCALAGHYNNLLQDSLRDGCKGTHPPVPGWEPR